MTQARKRCRQLNPYSILPEAPKPQPQALRDFLQAHSVPLAQSGEKRGDAPYECGLLGSSQASAPRLRDVSPGTERLGRRALWPEARALPASPGAREHWWAPGDRHSTVPGSSPEIHSFLPCFMHSFILPFHRHLPIVLILCLVLTWQQIPVTVTYYSWPFCPAPHSNTCRTLPTCQALC